MDGTSTLVVVVVVALLVPMVIVVAVLLVLWGLRLNMARRQHQETARVGPSSMLTMVDIPGSMAPPLPDEMMEGNNTSPLGEQKNGHGMPVAWASPSGTILLPPSALSPNSPSIPPPPSPPLQGPGVESNSCQHRQEVTSTNHDRERSMSPSIQ